MDIYRIFTHSRVCLRTSLFGCSSGEKSGSTWRSTQAARMLGKGTLDRTTEEAGHRVASPQKSLSSPFGDGKEVTGKDSLVLVP